MIQMKAKSSTKISNDDVDKWDLLIGLKEIKFNYKFMS